MTTYTPTVWTNDMPITDLKLNKIEDRIEEIQNIQTCFKWIWNNEIDILDNLPTYSQLTELINHNIVPVILFQDIKDNSYKSFMPEIDYIYSADQGQYYFYSIGNQTLEMNSSNSTPYFPQDGE